MPRKARVMAIALDAADPTLVREFAADGDMPTAARLLGEAAIVETRPPLGVYVSANWPTIFTAISPDRHRYLCWEEIRGGTYEHRLTNPTMVDGTPIWERLSEAGRRVAVIDVPHTVVRPVNGVMLSEWGCHDRHFGTGSWPPELAGELTARLGRHMGSADPPGFDHFAPCDYVHRAGPKRTGDEDLVLFDAICGGVGIKRKASLELLDRGGWDLFLSVLGEPHCVGHQLWHLHDASHPGHDAALVSRLGGDRSGRSIDSSTPSSPIISSGSRPKTPPTCFSLTGWSRTTTAPICSITFSIASTSGSTTRTASAGPRTQPLRSPAGSRGRSAAAPCALRRRCCAAGSARP
ncbi:MAG: alkaline phosphatase family protein, partial [Solirubrobacterales bacterium]